MYTIYKTILKIYRLTEKTALFKWTSECQTAEAPGCTRILAHPDRENPFLFDTSASRTGIGAILLQIILMEEKVIACTSRAFSKTEWQYCITQHELLAIVHFV